MLSLQNIGHILPSPSPPPRFSVFCLPITPSFSVTAQRFSVSFQRLLVYHPLSPPASPRRDKRAERGRGRREGLEALKLSRRAERRRFSERPTRGDERRGRVSGERDLSPAPALRQPPRCRCHFKTQPVSHVRVTAGAPPAALKRASHSLGLPAPSPLALHSRPRSNFQAISGAPAVAVPARLPFILVFVLQLRETVGGVSSRDSF